MKWSNIVCLWNTTARGKTNLCEKGRDLTQSYDKRPYTDRKIEKATWKHKNATKNFELRQTCNVLYFDHAQPKEHVMSCGSLRWTYRQCHDFNWKFSHMKLRMTGEHRQTFVRTDGGSNSICPWTFQAGYENIKVAKSSFKKCKEKRHLWFWFLKFNEKYHDLLYRSCYTCINKLSFEKA